MITLREWTQTEWITAGIDMYHVRGDFYSAPGLMPTPNREAMQRAPAWSAHLTHAGLTDVRGAFYDYANARYVLIGTNASSQLSSTYFSSAWSHVGSASAIVAACTTLGGFSMQNVLYYGGYLWLIPDNGRIYQGANYSAALTSFYTCSDARSLAPLGPRIYALRDVQLMRLDSAGTAMENHFNPTPLEIYPLALFPIRDGLAWFCRGNDASLILFHIPGYISGTWVHHMDMVATLPAVRIEQPSSGCLFTLHEGDVYFSPGAYPQPNGKACLDVYRFNGTSIDRVAHVKDALASPAARGLLSWRGELLYYEPYSGDPNVYILAGNHFYPLLPDTAAIPYTATTNPIVASLAGNLIITGSVAGAQGIHHAGSAAYADGYLQTSYLDFDHPGQKKALQRVTLQLDGASATTTLTIRYRKDDSSTWVALGTQTGGADNHLVSNGNGVEFYRIQFKAEIADTNTANQVRLLSLSAHYTIGFS